MKLIIKELAINVLIVTFVILLCNWWQSKSIFMGMRDVALIVLFAGSFTFAKLKFEKDRAR